jgi:hypothetical protein
MAAPPLTLEVGPFAMRAVRYAPLTPAGNGQPERYALSLHVEIGNTGAQPITVRKLTVTFPTASGVPSKEIKLWTPATSTTPEFYGLTIQPGQRRQPKDFTQGDTLTFETAPPNQVTFRILADGYLDEASFTRPLGRAKQSFRWFGRPHDLARGEYWKGTGGTHCCGPQLYAYDLGCIGYDKQAKKWSELKPGTVPGANASYRIWGKPIYAIADGVVQEKLDGIRSNTVGETNPDVNASGNHFLIRHGDALVYYSHMQRNTLAAVEPGDKVTEGDYLGLVGNSGNSFAPHLHVHTIDPDTWLLRPFTFHDTVMAPSHPNRPNQAQWQRADSRAIPFQDTLIYPSPVPPADGVEWSNWGSLGGVVTSAPTVASWGFRRLDVFVRGTDDALYQKWFDGESWHGWVSHGGILTSAPTAVSWGPNRVDVFVRATDATLYHKWWDGTKWREWEGLGGELQFAPAVCSRRPNHLDVFVAWSDDSLRHRIWNGDKWTPWENLGGVLGNSPAAVSWGNNRIDVFAPGTDGNLYQKWWDGTSWHDWASHEAVSLFAPAVSSRKANHLDVYTVAEDNTLWHRVWTGSTWSHWESLGGYLTEAPAAVSWDANRIDVFARGTDNAIYQTLWRPQD